MVILRKTHSIACECESWSGGRAVNTALVSCCEGWEAVLELYEFRGIFSRVADGKEAVCCHFPLLCRVCWYCAGRVLWCLSDEALAS